jgi:protein-S-isoprenylcysteine O-methyltransferase Ste14
MKLEKKIPPPIVTALFALLAYVSSLSGSHLVFQGQAILSLVILIIALAIIIIANVQFRRANTTINPFEPETASTLVSDGIFGHSRNPMYLAMAMALGSFCLYLGSWFGFIAIPAFIQYINRFQIIPEEEAMQSLFGQSFTDYCKSVRRWI